MTTRPGQRNSEGSVFNNPFRAKEAREKAILEKHVEMTNRQVSLCSGSLKVVLKERSRSSLIN